MCVLKLVTHDPCLLSVCGDIATSFSISHEIVSLCPQLLGQGPESSEHSESAVNTLRINSLIWLARFSFTDLICQYLWKRIFVFRRRTASERIMEVLISRVLENRTLRQNLFSLHHLDLLSCNSASKLAVFFQEQYPESDSGLQVTLALSPTCLKVGQGIFLFNIHPITETQKPETIRTTPHALQAALPDVAASSQAPLSSQVSVPL